MARQPAHQHFCSACMTRSKRKGTMARGWWRCTDTKCVMPESSPCKDHIGSQARAEKGQ